MAILQWGEGGGDTSYVRAFRALDGRELEPKNLDLVPAKKPTRAGSR
jgi:hypothetical protein